MAGNPNARAQVVQLLQEVGGCIRHPKGQATTSIATVLGTGTGGMASLLSAMERDGEILRDVRGKRTYEICLHEPSEATLKRVAKLPPRVTLARDAEQPVEAAPEPEESTPDVDLVVEETPEPTQPAMDPVEVADAILLRVADILARPDRTAELEAQVAGALSEVEAQRLREDLHEMQERLSITLEENQRMRTRLRDAGDELRAKDTRIAQLNREKRELEENLRKIMKEGGRAIRGEVVREIDRFMRQAPASPKGED